MRKLHQMATIFTAVGIDKLFRIARPFFYNEIPILTYHRVINTDKNYPFDSDLISATPTSFEQQMNFVKANYTAISMTEFISSLESNKQLPKNPILITFDDGFDDNYFNAYPILKKLDIPATFFVTTDYIGKQDTIWYERLAYFFNNTKANNIVIDELSLKLEVTETNRFACYQDLIESLKLNKDDLRKSILNSLYNKYGDPYLNISTKEKCLSQFMTWEHLNELSQNNITIDSHSHTHPILSMLSQKQLSFELSESKKLIEERLKNRVKSIAYPVGQENSISTAVRNEAMKQQYAIGFSFISGMCDLNSIDKFNIKRLHIELDYPMALFKSILSLPAIFAE